MGGNQPLACPRQGGADRTDRQSGLLGDLGMVVEDDRRDQHQVTGAGGSGEHREAAVLAASGRRRLGGMCHYLLADRPRLAGSQPPDGRYGSDALALFIQRMQEAETDPAQYVAGIYGGANEIMKEIVARSL